MTEPLTPDDLIADGLGPDVWYDEHLDGDYAATPEEVERVEAERTAWRITGTETALWAATKLRQIQRRRDAAQATADALIARARVFLADETDATDRDVRFFTNKLADWYDAEIATRGAKTKTVPLPGGIKLTSKVGSVTSRILEDDAEALLAWCEANAPEAVDYPAPTVNRTKLNGHDLKGKVDPKEAGEYPAVDKASGEVVPGLVYVRGEASFDITFSDVDGEA